MPTSPHNKVTFTPTQNLILEVLAARARCGEIAWTFESRHRKAIGSLATMGLVGEKSGIAENTRLAWLTEAGWELVMSDDYSAPAFATLTAQITELEDLVSLLYTPEMLAFVATHPNPDVREAVSTYLISKAELQP